jgi:hypothetical protein
MFTEKDLIERVNTRSYDRGKSYFKSGAVRKLKFRNNTFEAVVIGTDHYDVSIEVDVKGKIKQTYCECPYDDDGDCKHIVATGLAAIEYARLNKLNVESLAAKVSDRPAFSDVFTDSKDTEKLLFLNHLLLKNIDLQQTFIQFIAAQNDSKKDVGSPNVIEQISTEIYEGLSDLSFDEETLMENADHESYYDEGFGENEVDAMIEEVLAPYQRRVEQYIREGRLLDTMQVWLGVYEGILSAIEPQKDDYGLLYDYVSTNKNCWISLNATTIELAHHKPFAFSTVKQAFDLLFDRYRKNQKLQNVENNESQPYLLKDFESLLLALVSDKESANYLRTLLEEKKLVNLDTVYVVLHTAELTNDDSYIMKLRKKFAPFDKVIAIQLLEQLANDASKVEFIEEAKTLFELHKNDIDKLIIDTIQPHQASELYVTSLRNYCVRKKDIASYRQLRLYLSETEKQELIQAEKNSWLNHFYVEMLEVEERTGEMLAYVKNKQFWKDANLKKTIKIVANYEPDEMMKLIAFYAQEYLAAGERGRTTYSLIASWLEAAQSSEYLKQKAAQFAKFLVSEYPRLSALKDELRQVGFKW